MLNNATAHLLLGQQGEDWATLFLREQGLCILARNWRWRNLELDIVAKDKETLVFVEVKTRTTDVHGEPALAVNTAKQAKLLRAAHAWLSSHKSWHTPCRFDIIALVGIAPNFRVEHYRHAFEFSEIVGRRNSHWQPW